ncbi:MAG TPA: 1,4-dihydroxy-2-naphthoate polyprenyltransferase [Thermoanaerobaculia bacterium]|nr:1,4-dihydroxy-2-naphthoate polyprenyltransferase [Thermoanaerobaculia bacterium]
MLRARDWILAARPKTLTAAVIPVVVGVALAFSATGRVEWVWALLALAGALLIQIATNLVNDAIDYEKGTDDAQRVGPIRVTASGLIEARQVKHGAWICFAAAAVVGIPLLIRGGWPLLAIGLASIAAGYAYTGGPYPLAYHGMGEVFVLAFFGPVAVGGTYWLQTLSIAPDVLIAGLAIGMPACVLLAVNNLRDVEGDARSGKRTLAVRGGRRFAVGEIAVFAFTPLLLGAWWWWRGERVAALLPLLLAPLAATIVRSAMRDRGAALNATLGRAAALHAGYGLLFSVGMIVG